MPPRQVNIAQPVIVRGCAPPNLLWYAQPCTIEGAEVSTHASDVWNNGTWDADLSVSALDACNDSAEGADHISLGQRPRIRSNRKRKKGCRPVPYCLFLEIFEALVVNFLLAI